MYCLKPLCQDIIDSSHCLTPTNSVMFFIMKMILGFQVNIFHEDQHFLLFVYLVTDGNMDTTDTWDEAELHRFQEKKRKRYKTKKMKKGKNVTRSKGEGGRGIVNSSLRLVL